MKLKKKHELKKQKKYLAKIKLERSRKNLGKISRIG